MAPQLGDFSQVNTFIEPSFAFPEEDTVIAALSSWSFGKMGDLLHVK